MKSPSILLKKSQFTKELPVKFTGDFFYKYFTFKLILKKSYQEGVFEFFNPDPQLVQNFKPTRNLPGHI